MVDLIRSGVQILVGMDEGDYSGLLEEIRKTRKTEWTCHENTQVGDTVFIYFGEKIGELVACGKVLKPRWEVEGWTSPSWRYRTKIGNLERVHGVTREAIRKQLPGLTWINQPRMHKPLTSEQAKVIADLVNQSQTKFDGVGFGSSFDELMAEEFVGVEGEKKLGLVAHRKREIKLRLAKIAKAKVINNGKLICEVPGCAFDFEKVYGPIGSNYAQVHHLIPLSSSDDQRETNLLELAIVCANCHVMIHRGGECRDLESLVVKPGKRKRSGFSQETK
jgi:predicted HNH restriction endonuclease